MFFQILPIWGVFDILIANTKVINPLSPHDALKHYFSSLKNGLISWNLVVLEQKQSWNCFKSNRIFFVCHPLLAIFCKSRIATAIRGL